MKFLTKLFKRSKGAPPLKAASKAAAATLDFALADNGDDTCMVVLVDAAGNQSDATGLATITVTSSDPTKLTVDAPIGVTFAMHAVGPLTVAGSPVQVTVVATLNAPATAGPFTAVLPVDIVSGGPTGVQIVPGVPTTH